MIQLVLLEFRLVQLPTLLKLLYGLVLVVAKLSAYDTGSLLNEQLLRLHECYRPLQIEVLNVSLLTIHEHSLSFYKTCLFYSFASQGTAYQCLDLDDLAWCYREVIYCLAGCTLDSTSLDYR